MRTYDIEATKADVQNFYTEGMDQLDHLVIGEEKAKLGMLVVMATGTNGVFVGEPGGGKTTLAENAHRLVDGIHDDSVAVIPPLADLRPRQMVGGQSTVTRTTNGMEEEIRTDISSIIDQGTQVIWADEINRGAPHAINSLLGALASRKFSNTDGEIPLLDLEYAISTMNPGGINEGVFKINPANASRHAVGVTMGLGENGEKDEIITDLLGGWRSNPDEMSTVTDLVGLHNIRNYIRGEGRSTIAFPESVQAIALDRIKQARRLLDEEGIEEAVPRLAIQTADSARAITAFYGEDSVTPESVDEALEFVVGARVGMRKQNPEKLIPEIMGQITGK